MVTWTSNCTRCFPSGFSLVHTLSAMFMLILMYVSMLMLFESIENLPCSQPSLLPGYVSPLTFPFLFSRSALLFRLLFLPRSFSTGLSLHLWLQFHSYLFQSLLLFTLLLTFLSPSCEASALAVTLRCQCIPFIASLNRSTPRTYLLTSPSLAFNWTPLTLMMEAAGCF